MLYSIGVPIEGPVVKLEYGSPGIILHDRSKLEYFRPWLLSSSHYSFNSTSNLVSVGKTSVYRAFDSCAAGPMVGPIVSLGLDTAFLKYANNVLKEIVGSALMYLMQQDEPNPNKIACHMYAKRMIQNKLQYGPLMGGANTHFFWRISSLKSIFIFY